MASQDWRDGKSADAMYKSSSASAPSTSPNTVEHGTGSGLDFKHAPQTTTMTESLGEAAARIKKEKAAKAAKATPTKDAPAKASVPSYKTGTDYVPKTGLALLHEGEKVIPKEENESAKSAKPEGDSEFSEMYRSIYLRKKLNAPKDGTPISGFVTEKQNRSPRECGNCKWFKGTKDGHCGHPLVMVDPKVPGETGKPKPVDSDDCCDNFQNK